MFFCAEYPFQIIRTGTEHKIKIVVQANIIWKPEGVQLGRLIVLYHVLPAWTKYDAAEPAITTSNGIRK